MRYLGSKRTIVKDILPLMIKKRDLNQYWVEPFMGGCNVIEHVNGNRIANDINFYVVELFKYITNTPISKLDLPMQITEEQYIIAKMYKSMSSNEYYLNKKLMPPWLIGFIGIGCSFGSKWFGGFARERRYEKNNRQFAAEVTRSLLKQIPLIKGVKFTNLDYREIQIPKNSIIYCDPPYANTTDYGTNFNQLSFFNWCRDKRKKGHTIFVSSYVAPKDFICIYEKPLKHIKSSMGTIKSTERLFTL